MKMAELEDGVIATGRVMDALDVSDGEARFLGSQLELFSTIDDLSSAPAATAARPAPRSSNACPARSSWPTRPTAAIRRPSRAPST